MTNQPRCSLACLPCRAKKKKCDSLGPNDPCTNCRLGGLECAIVQGRKKRQRRHYPDSSATLKQSLPATCSANKEDQVKQVKLAALPNSVFADHESNKSGLPPYIAEVDKDIPMEDLNYLKAIGALDIPDSSLCLLAVQAYIQFVHPYLPCVDLQHFLSSIQSHGSSGRISLLLFQAVIFVALAFIDDRIMQNYNFQNTPEARKIFFRRVKALHDFDVETDRLVMIQASLLMSYFYETPNEPKDVEHWLGIAITLARSGGLHKAETYSGLELREKRHLKRIWWSCYSRDRLFCMGFHRSPQFRDDDFDAPSLQVHDMEEYDVVRRVSRSCGIQIPYLDPSKQSLPANMFIQYLGLCKLIGRTLGIRKALDRSEDFRAHRYELIDFSQHIRCDDDLKEWHNSLPADLHFTATNPEDSPTTSFQLITLHRAFLKSVYCSTVTKLHCSLFRACHYDRFSLPQHLKVTTRARLHESAIELSTMFRDIDARGFVKLVPLAAISGLFAAMQCHALEIEVRRNYAPETLLRNVHRGTQVLRVAGDLYASAAFVSSAIDSAIRRALHSNKISPSDLHFPARGTAVEPMSLPYAGANELAVSQLPDTFLNNATVLSWFNLTSAEKNLLSELAFDNPSEMPTIMSDIDINLPESVSVSDDSLSSTEDLFQPTAETPDDAYLDFIQRKDPVPYSTGSECQRFNFVGKLQPTEAFFWRLIDSSLSPLLPIAQA
ncbi:hypothetical protein B0A52_08576 [Exophiala mesophila]|uniref:Zn(2)-C6 fungal-type domain-containing protein n=1 Tax=Exophiala mesophila TaxID=212818 RepID=A0A438MW57_EXOME|nr:hypothetical protein B0A52_08576 [Exophiala mesophila]